MATSTPDPAPGVGGADTAATAVAASRANCNHMNVPAHWDGTRRDQSTIAVRAAVTAMNTATAITAVARTGWFEATSAASTTTFPVMCAAKRPLSRTNE